MAGKAKTKQKKEDEKNVVDVSVDENKIYLKHEWNVKILMRVRCEFNERKATQNTKNSMLVDIF